jgi:hypothetical protein
MVPESIPPPEEVFLLPILSLLTIGVPEHTRAEWVRVWETLAHLLAHKLYTGRVVPTVYLQKLNAWLLEAERVRDSLGRMPGGTRYEKPIAGALCAIRTLYPEQPARLCAAHEHDEALLASVAILLNTGVPPEDEGRWHTSWQEFITQVEYRRIDPACYLRDVYEIAQASASSERLCACIDIIASIYWHRLEVHLKTSLLFRAAHLTPEIGFDRKV